MACSVHISDADQDCIENGEVRDLIMNIGIYTMHQKGQPEFILEPQNNLIKLVPYMRSKGYFGCLLFTSYENSQHSCAVRVTVLGLCVLFSCCRYEASYEQYQQVRCYKW